MKRLTDRYQLRNGISIPCVGFGTWQTPDGETAVAAVKEALAVGYRHIDTAAIYGNEESVGRAIKESDVERERLFITSKVWNTDHGYDATLKAFETTMKKLDLDYLDLYLIHWPNPAKFRDCWEEANAGTWKAMEELYTAGKVRAIGLSNFMPHHIEPLLKTAKYLPMVNQIKLCPGETQEETVRYCKERYILVEAYSPLGTGKVFDVPEMKALAEKYGKTVAQICLRWSLQMGFLPLPKSVTPARIKENADIFDFELSAEDVALISGLKGCCGETPDPDHTKF
ncbi:MAG TPA: aldo/keto reductase [Candidatus Gallacutalibacter stercoravium]|nr:aldo/keto reductase [Candidatus Gallacutalibacter stercoravium]